MYVDSACIEFSVEREKLGILNLQFTFSYEVRELEQHALDYQIIFMKSRTGLNLFCPLLMSGEPG
jgi:hypothetical protein